MTVFVDLEFGSALTGWLRLRIPQEVVSRCWKGLGWWWSAFKVISSHDGADSGSLDHTLTLGVSQQFGSSSARPLEILTDLIQLEVEIGEEKKFLILINQSDFIS